MTNGDLTFRVEMHSGYQRSLAVTNVHWILPAFTGCYQRSLDITNVYWMLPMFTGCYQRSPDATNVHWMSPMFPGSHQCSPDVTNVHWMSPMFTGSHQCSLDVTNVHWMLPTFPGRSQSFCRMADHQLGHWVRCDLVRTARTTCPHAGSHVHHAWERLQCDAAVEFCAE
jgi:hypothetical protein